MDFEKSVRVVSLRSNSTVSTCWPKFNMNIGVIPYMSVIILHLGLSIFWIRSSLRHKPPCFAYARIQNVERPRFKVIPDM